MLKKKYINVNGPEYRGAPIPPFRSTMVNESMFEDELRLKEANLIAYIDPKDPSKNYGEVQWLSQESDYSTDKWRDEIKRAFRMNGLIDGNKIQIEFGSRDSGLNEEFELEV